MRTIDSRVTYMQLQAYNYNAIFVANNVVNGGMKKPITWDRGGVQRLGISWSWSIGIKVKHLIKEINFAIILRLLGCILHIYMMYTQNKANQREPLIGWEEAAS
ncbi:hypothetical protein VNO77_06460 [Canavalia gladiata]|uniref:Uncharacterized protein n=1 Tax=Canavalia gladiata TaxID=3824 RepID=A0AAN9R026_CANGL